MRHDMFDKNPFVDELDEEYHPQIIPPNIKNPPLVFIFKIIEGWENGF